MWRGDRGSPIRRSALRSVSFLMIILTLAGIGLTFWLLVTQVDWG